jgi:hypothetical protein
MEHLGGFREHLGEYSGNIQVLDQHPHISPRPLLYDWKTRLLGGIREHSGNIWGGFREHLGGFREHLGGFTEHLGGFRERSGRTHAIRSIAAVME